MQEIFSKLIVKTPEGRHNLRTDFKTWSGVSVVDVQKIHAGWVKDS